MSQRGAARRRPDLSARGDVSRAAILAAARDQFSKDGFRGASLASVAEQAGLSQAGLLHHFGSKSAVLLAVLAERDRADHAWLASPEVQQRGLAHLRSLEGLMEHNQVNPEIIRLYSVLLGEAVSPDHPAHAYFLERYPDVRGTILRNLELAEANREIEAGHDLEAIAAVIVAVFDGLQFQWLLDDSIDMVRCYRMVCDLLIAQLADGLSTGGPGVDE